MTKLAILRDGGDAANEGVSAMSDFAIAGPHQSHVSLSSPAEHFLAQLFDRLWEQYRARVSYVRDYEVLVHEAGAAFVNDHIAFRTFAANDPLVGIAALSRPFEALGYVPAGVYHFADKHLNAIHYQHPNGDLPKLFISELKTWELSAAAQAGIASLVKSHRPPLAGEVLRSLGNLSPGDPPAGLLQTLTDWIQVLPWKLPERSAVEALNEESQYAAWVAVHGYNVNHFTSLINSHRVAALADIEKTIHALATAGVPMKQEIEGEAGSKLRQSATQAVVIEVEVAENGVPTTMPWTYAYFELAERGEVIDPTTGASGRFEGFLGPQATQLFEMTRKKS